MTSSFAESFMSCAPTCKFPRELFCDLGTNCESRITVRETAVIVNIYVNMCDLGIT